MPGYKMRNPPLKHQTKLAKVRRSRPRRPCPDDVFGMLMEMGTGKSYSLLEDWNEAVNDGTAESLFILAPAGSYKNWYRDKNETQRAELVEHLDPRLYKRLRIAPWEKGAEARAQRNAALTAPPGTPRVCVMNVEALSKKGKAFAYAMEFLSRGKVTFAIDESTAIRDHTSKRTKNILELRDYAIKKGGCARRILTGLVSPKSPMNLFSQFFFLDWRILGHQSFVTFRARYAMTERVCYVPHGLLREKLRAAYMRRKFVRKGGKMIPATDEHRQYLANKVPEFDRSTLLERLEQEKVYVPQRTVIKEYRNLDELYELIKPYSYRVLKKDCLDLKPKQYTIREVPLTLEQIRMYDEIKRYATTQINDGHVVAGAIIQQIVRLHQISCGHVVDEEKVTHDVPSDRIPTALDVIREHEGKVIIWSCYKREIYKMRDALLEEYGEELGEDCVAMFHGDNKKTRDEDERRFLSNPNCRFMISTQSAGGKGNTWNVATMSVYLCNSYDLEHRMQSEDRNHRKGQKESVVYVDLVSRGTVDERIIEALRKKIDLAAIVNGDNYMEWLI